METYSERLSWAIKNAGVTQSDLAAMIGVKPQTVQYLCAKKNNAQGSIHNASFAKILKVSAVWLETGNGDRYPESSKAEETLKLLGINLDELDLDQIEIIQSSMATPKEDRPHLKRIIKTFTEPDKDDGEQGNSG
ncbi:hypothetical protein SAMN05216302_101155 [Nitrosomonas aestuarii]|uniref:HTH cro/C1-type domain-containing protein n=1 Tax=Nitrosomonas aestuarii TaxID=52441 RepID=A0A1I4B8J1_9PROT|nr:hypothetical protein [Nitrosomonas aestuarii]SFK64289.1 hypothetical protein SAMN05216302_101155 [Nitrosomonas aestuarii]